MHSNGKISKCVGKYSDTISYLFPTAICPALLIIQKVLKKEIKQYLKQNAHYKYTSKMCTGRSK